MFFFPAIPFIETAIDFATISFIVSLLILSLFSICFIFHLRFKSRSSRHLKNFNSLWTVRFLLVFFIAFWALIELLRLPFFRRLYFYPLILPQLTVTQQANFCNLHLVFSLGCFEPGFLVTLLFLLDVSVKKTNPITYFGVFFVGTSCIPLLFLQVYFVFFQGPDHIRLPEPFHRSWFVAFNSYGDKTVWCAYPLISTLMFGAFGALFTFSFLVSFWRVVSHVINKNLKFRIYALALAVVVTLPLKVLLMAASVFWTPDKTAFDVVALAVFLSTFICAVVGEGILVIKPISDSLAAGGGRSSVKNSHGGWSSQPPPMGDGVCTV